MAAWTRALIPQTMAFLSVLASLNLLHASRSAKESKKGRFLQYSEILKHQKEKPPLETLTIGAVAYPLRDKEDLASLFCPKLLQKTEDKTAPFPFAPRNTGTANVLDYLRSLDTSSDLNKAGAELLKGVEGPARKELEQYQKLAQQIKANSEAHKAYTVRLRKHFSTQYKTDKDANNEAAALRELSKKISSQAANDFREMEALGFKINASYRTREADPIVNSNILHFDHGFVYNMNERRSFLDSLPKENPLSIASISETADYVQGGASKKLTEVFLVDGEFGHKVAVDEHGKYYISSNNPPTPFEALCDSSIAAPPPKEATNISELINRFLETGHIKLNPKECADLQKQFGEYDSTGTYIAKAMTNAIDYRGKEGVEILIPKNNLSEDLKKALDQVTPDIKANEQKAAETARTLTSITDEMKKHLAESQPAETKKESDPGALSDEVRLRQFEEDAKSLYEGEGIGPSLDALKKNYSSLILTRPDLANKFLKAHHDSQLATEKLNTNRVKAEGLRSTDHFPLALVSDLTGANMDTFHNALLSAKGTAKETPTIPIGFTYEHSVNPETGNLEIYLCEDPAGEPQLPLKRLNSKPLFTIDKENLKNTRSTKESNDSAYNSSLWATIADNLGCPGEPPVDFSK